MKNYENVVTSHESCTTMNKLGKFLSTAAVIGLALGARSAAAHFQEIIPSADIVAVEGERTVALDIVFTHPMERGPTMDMGQPAQFGVLTKGKKTDLRGALTKKDVNGKAAFGSTYRFTEPGDYVFYIEPAPFWEPAEKKYILHYAKAVVDFGSGEDWDALVGFPIEIQPLTRPYGVWTGNLFRGVVKKNGKPLAFADVEIEWVNDGSVKAPADPFITQVVKTDAQGVFAYAMPRAGWWAFNALTDADKPIKGPDGKPARVEIGGTIWVKAVDMK
ncbi:ABC-type Co2+ transport system, periplasmic component [Rhodopseudomonas palustris BisB18]|uniref:ABC-type Co2+ transport system, periplasmic component n=2 Tax=Rhodopseudomonas palustris TaxID=1076 RepID=Q217C7_RHOPB